MRWLLVRFGVVAVVLAVAACVPAGGPGVTIEPTPLAPASLTPQERPSFEAISMPPADMTPQPPQASLPASIIDPIVADAAARTGAAPSDVTVISSEAVTWPDRGLGCPLPGVEYPQVPVDGYRVVVRAGGQDLDYRGSGAGQFRLCEKK